MESVVGKIDRILVVEDDDALRRAIARVARTWHAEVFEAATAARACELLESASPGLVIVDVVLPDGRALSVLEAAARQIPAPAIVAMSGKASPEEAFELARAGAQGYLAKPISLESLSAEVERVLRRPPDLAPLLKASVGHVHLREIQADVRQTMVEQALAVARGSRRGAARLLGISRQAVQQFVRRGE